MSLRWEDTVKQVYRMHVKQVEGLWETNPRLWLGRPLTTASLNAEIGSNGEVNVKDDTADSIAKQFYVYMPGHSFKVEDVISRIDTEHRLPLSTERACLAIIDIGCGGATASTALVNLIVQNTKVQNNRFVFIGIDTNECAVQLYDWMMTGFATTITRLTTSVTHHSVIKGMPEALTFIAEGLYQAKIRWGIPSLSDLWIIQSNVVRPLHSIWSGDIKVRDRLGLNAQQGLIPDDFGEIEARSYEQLLQLSQADRMLVVTVAANDSHRAFHHLEPFATSLNQTFVQRGHSITKLISAYHTHEPLAFAYENPDGSYWRSARSVRSYIGKYYADVQIIESQQFKADKAWQEIISEKNLVLAWARVRASMMRESLVDEVGLTLFEQQLSEKRVPARLAILRNQLLTYTVRTEDYPRLFYEVPKDKDNTRPRAIQKIEEELLAVAVIQVLGRGVQSLMSRNYGYRLATSEQTEYLYRPWIRSYSRFKNAVRRAINGMDDGGVVLKSDIASFYPSIPQERLYKRMLILFNIEEHSRAAWILRQLLIRQSGEREAGVLQGPIASGFWANLYLLELDAYFSDDYVAAMFYRYVDDMILVAGDRQSIERITNDLQDKIDEMGLRLSQEKTEIIDAAKARQDEQQDGVLSSFDKRFRQLMEGLFFTDKTYHKQAGVPDNQSWWLFIRTYQQCLRSLGIFVELSRLSRKTWQYVTNPILATAHRYQFPEYKMINAPDVWAVQFGALNEASRPKIDSLRGELSDLLQNQFNQWKQLNARPVDENDQVEMKVQLKRCRTFIGFALNRLSRLGYDLVLDVVEEIFCEHPYILKSHRLIIDHLGLQGHTGTIDAMWSRLVHADFAGASYIKALLLRGFRYRDVITDPESLQILETVALGLGSEADDPFRIEALMASETLIVSVHYRAAPVEARLFLQRSIEVNEQHPQWSRNLQILASRSASGRPEFAELYDLILPELIPLIENGNLREPEWGVDEHEPEILRENYYQSRYPDNAEEFETDYL